MWTPALSEAGGELYVNICYLKESSQVQLMYVHILFVKIKSPLPYVGDIQTTGSDSNSIDTAITKLKNRFEVVDLGEAFFHLGLTIKCDEETGSIEYSWETYVRGLLEKSGMMKS